MSGTGFPPATREQWRELAREVLRRSGSETDSPEEALASTTYDGITVAPLHDASDLPETPGLPGLAPYAPGGRGLGGPWEVRQRHEVADREAVLTDLENGVDSLWLAVAPRELPRALDGVHLDWISITLDAGDRTGEAADALLSLAAANGVPAASLRGCFGADPLNLPGGAAFGLAETAELARRCADGLPGMRAVVADATPYHEAGGGDADELGCSIATGLAYVRALTDHGLGVDEAFGQVEFRYAASADQFATIAKLRAARVLWARVAEVCGGPSGQFQHAVTSAAMMTRRDPWTNMLRTTLACFAAGVGGADAVTVRPFDDALGLPDGFSRRIARNTSALLVEEGHVARVTDPAAGSWYVERLTADLAEKAWQWFQEIEEAGGMAAALATGLVRSRIARTRESRSRDIARRKAPIVGVSQFPDLSEPAPALNCVPQPPAGALPRIRHAQAFEDLRDRAEALPARPAVFLAAVGSAREHAARVSFAAGLFQAGGVETVTSSPAADPDAIAKEFAASGTAVACLCSSDEAYAEHASAVAAALRKAGAVRIWLAGRGRYDGVDGNLYAGCDVLEVLRTTLADLEVDE
ncbi:methylmalonyl-CoA mutase family protein [Microbispora sp. H11081]|uniref:methylmalonyl-CoA mutase family protein n=1 Tax=Microbispora sp. H11081 TaxID=2729107 RepID=UPI0014748C52|nr:methylmalonyl-CoA mutase family protein [Microbispora sp. H11081]